MCKHQQKKKRNFQRQVSWRKLPLEVLFDRQSGEVYCCLFACTRLPQDQAHNQVKKLLLWEWIQSQDGEKIFGVALAKAMISRTYRDVLFTVVEALVPVWTANDSAQEGDKMMFAHLPQFCWSFPRLAGCLVTGCNALEVPLDLSDLLMATENSGGVYSGSTFQDCLERNFLRARARWLSGQMKRQEDEEVVMYAAHELLRNFTAENFRVRPGLHSGWLYIFLFVESVYKDHLGRFELDGSACLATEDELEEVLRKFLTIMTDRHKEMRDAFVRSEAYWRWNEALESIHTLEWHRYVSVEDGSSERMVALIRRSFTPQPEAPPAQRRFLPSFSVCKALTCSRYL